MPKRQRPFSSSSSSSDSSGSEVRPLPQENASTKSEAQVADVMLIMLGLQLESEDQQSLQRLVDESRDAMSKERAMLESTLAAEQKRFKLEKAALASSLTAERKKRKASKEKRKAAKRRLKDVEAKLTAALADLAKERRQRESAEKQLAENNSQEARLEATLRELAKEREQREAAERQLAENSFQETMLAATRADFAKEREQRECAERQVARRNLAEAKLMALLSKKMEQLKATVAQLATEGHQREAAQKQLAELQEKQRFASHGVCWQYEMDGHWHPFSPEGNDQVQVAYLAYIADDQQYRTKIVAGGVERVVDFQQMTQMHASTKKVRNIRIVTGVPQQWESGPASLLTQGDHVASFYIEVKDPQVIERVRHILRSTGHAGDPSSPCGCMQRATVKSVHRVENFGLWHRYQAKLKIMRQDRARHNVSNNGPAPLDLDGQDSTMSSSQSFFDCGEELEPDMDEKMLLHGTSWHNANSIVVDGFDHRTCTRGMYGEGVYFAGAACKSHQYSLGVRGYPSNRSYNCERTLIIARVALGDAYYASETRYGQRRPPLKSGTTRTYDSVVVKPGPITGHHKSTQIHQEFVLFDRDQAYPSFVVQYIA